MMEIIDLSQHNGTVNWSKVRQSGIGGVILRIGIRGYAPAGSITMDSRWKENLAGALTQNIPIGAYFFSQAITAQEGAAEAEWCHRQLEGVTLTLPLFVDSEYGNQGKGRADTLTPTQRCAAVNGFLDQAKALGHRAGVYASDSWFRSFLPPAMLHTDRFWVARYGSQPQTVPGWTGWQYTDSGSNPGVIGKVDKNRFAKTILKEEEPMENTQVRIGAKTVEGYLLDGVTYVPLRALVDALSEGLQVTWNADDGAEVKLT